MSVALNSFKLLPLLQLDVGMKPFVQSGVFTETSQNELVAAAAHHAVPCSLRIARWGSAASRARLVARMRWYGARVCCPGRPPVSCAPSVTITESTDRIAHFSGLASQKRGQTCWLCWRRTSHWSRSGSGDMGLPPRGCKWARFRASLNSLELLRTR